MIKNILSLEGVNTIDKNEQKNINGGFWGAGNSCRTNGDCWDRFPYLGPGDVGCRNGNCFFF